MEDAVRSSRKDRNRSAERSGKRPRARDRGPLTETIRAGADLYDRQRHLPWLARATPAELSSENPETILEIVERLSRALAAERRRGRANHWSYDMNRHIALLQALAAERQRLDRGTRPRRHDLRTCA
ncbi:DUF6477 family protein [Microbaculum marinum]|uniref:DUF6477 family protein n=1 Tax=Microbaculum marinum TaxID=1764581 RepID=A0AAW9RUU2_9HYPH